MTDRRREGLRWRMSGRVRLAEALHPAELDILLDALDSPEGIQRARQELEWAQEALPVADATRERVRASSEGLSLVALEETDRRRRELTRPGTVEVAAGDMERARIIRLMRATRWETYRAQNDPEA